VGYPARATGRRGVPGVAPVVLASWERSLAAGVDPGGGPLPPVLLDGVTLPERRAGHPLAAGLPVIRWLLDDLIDSGEELVWVADANGVVLWVLGGPLLRHRAGEVNFVPGALWDEAHAGTTALGVALVTAGDVEVAADEHLCGVLRGWSCAAAAVHDLGGGHVAGVVGAAWPHPRPEPHARLLLRSVARSVEGELLVQAARHREAAAAVPPHPHQGRRAMAHQGRRGVPLQALGGDGAVIGAGLQAVHLRRRFAEVVVLLALHPSGVTAEQLSLLLLGDGANPVTVRAEMSRLRHLLGEDVLASRPYRLEVDVDADFAKVRRALREGRLRAALRSYAGPLLPSSEAPGICAERTDLELQLRAAVLSTRDPGLLRKWVEAPWGREDAAAWEALAAGLPSTANARASALARAAALTHGGAVGAP
jgi:hypothetical protein